MQTSLNLHNLLMEEEVVFPFAVNSNRLMMKIVYEVDDYNFHFIGIKWATKYCVHCTLYDTGFCRKIKMNR